MNSQTQSVGEGAVAVQIAGDHNTTTLIVGGSKFVHNQLHKSKSDPQNIN